MRIVELGVILCLLGAGCSATGGAESDETTPGTAGTGVAEASGSGGSGSGTDGTGSSSGGHVSGAGSGGGPLGTGGFAGQAPAVDGGGIAPGPGFDGGVGRCALSAAEQKTLPAGTWTNVTPATKGSAQGGTIDSTISYSGAQDVVVDPVRPSDLYVVINYLGMWKSTDYGLTWTKVSTGMNGAIIDTGKTWTMGIDPDCHRDPQKPPTVYTTNWAGTGHMGLWKSTNGGVDWARCGDVPIANQDVYSVDIDPYDSQHLIIGYHEEMGLSESSDGCATWKGLPAAPEPAFSTYPFFIDTGDAAGTRKTWLLIGQGGGMYRTADEGATIAMVDPLTHAHGSAQIFQAGGGVIYAAGGNGSQGSGVYRSTDYGATWKRINDGAVQNAVYATPNYIYADYGWSCIDCTLTQHLQRAPHDPGTAWSQYMPTPLVMQLGAKRAAVTFDGSHYIIVSGNRNNGILRYVE
jgi:hypothetical protein